MAKTLALSSLDDVMSTELAAVTLHFGNVEVPDFDAVVPRRAYDLRLVAVDAVDRMQVRGVALYALVPAST